MTKEKYSIDIEFDKDKFSGEQLKVKRAIAEFYASSPFKTKKSKDKDIKNLFK
jgi:hypothetical protein